jgi:hypothetical protein
VEFNGLSKAGLGYKIGQFFTEILLLFQGDLCRIMIMRDLMKMDDFKGSKIFNPKKMSSRKQSEI